MISPNPFWWLRKHPSAAPPTNSAVPFPKDPFLRWQYTLVMIDCQGTDTSLTHLPPGFTVILEVERSASEEPAFFTLEEAEESRTDGLISQYPEVLDIWHEDSYRIASLVLDANLRLERDKTTHPGRKKRWPFCF